MSRAAVRVARPAVGLIARRRPARRDHHGSATIPDRNSGSIANAAPLTALLLVASGCATASLPPTAPALPARFTAVEPGLFVGAHADPRRLRALVERYGIKTVIQLNPDWQGRDAPPPGVTLWKRPIPAVFTPAPGRIEEILEALDTAPRPIFLHCRIGVDRTALIVALYRVRHGMPPAEARRRLKKGGFHAYPGLVRTWERFVGPFW